MPQHNNIYSNNPSLVVGGNGSFRGNQINMNMNNHSAIPISNNAAQNYYYNHQPNLIENNSSSSLVPAINTSKKLQFTPDPNISNRKPIVTATGNYMASNAAMIQQDYYIKMNQNPPPQQQSLGDNRVMKIYRKQNSY